MKRTIVLISAVLLLITGRILYAEEQGRIVGGACSYDRIPGTCKIISVTKTSDSIRQAAVTGGPGYEGFAIKFRFTPSAQKQEYSQKWADRIGDVLAKEYTLLLTNSWYPGEKFLDKYKIVEAKTFDCKLGLITKGACAPVILEFPDINTSDYFETKK
jgi:hypothetical protein